LLNIYQLRLEWRSDGDDLYRQAALFCILTWFIYFHVRLLLFADYPTLLSLRLVPFLQKLETVLDKYIHSFKVISVMAGFYLLALGEKLLSLLNGGAAGSFSQNGFYKWLIIIFLAVSFYILLLHALIPKYRKLLDAVRRYKYGIVAREHRKINPQNR
jgi:CBS domain containing-hemolysin-like protein